MIVVSDTSALSNLAIVDHLWLLKALYQSVIVPDVVATELAAASNPTISAILQLGWIQTKSLINSQLADQLQQERGLDAGEANAIAWAFELQADALLIAERLGRQEAVRLELLLVSWVFCLWLSKDPSSSICYRCLDQPGWFSRRPPAISACFSPCSRNLVKSELKQSVEKAS